MMSARTLDNTDVDSAAARGRIGARVRRNEAFALLGVARILVMATVRRESAANGRDHLHLQPLGSAPQTWRPQR